MQRAIIIVLRDSLAANGLRHWFTDTYGLQAVVTDSVTDIETAGALDVALIVTDTTTFVAQLSFFLPRRSRTIVITHGSFDGSDGSVTLVDAIDTTQLRCCADQLLNASPVPASTPPSLLTQREVEVLSLVARGRINKEIADELSISINTVLSHRKNITAKLGIKSTAGLTFYALMNGIK